MRLSFFSLFVCFTLGVNLAHSTPQQLDKPLSCSDAEYYCDYEGPLGTIILWKAPKFFVHCHYKNGLCHRLKSYSTLFQENCVGVKVEVEGNPNLPDIWVESNTISPTEYGCVL